VKNDLEKFIKDNRDAFDKKMPPPIVLDRILQQMGVKEEVKPKGVLIPFRVIWMAAACFLLMAFGAAFWIFKKQTETAAIVKTAPPAAPQVKSLASTTAKAEPAAEATKNENPARKSVEAVDEDLARRQQVLMARLEASNLRSQKEVVFAGLRNMESPATRITVASEAYKLKNTGNDIVDALVSTLNNDPNANVRLAALDGLARFYSETYVRKKLVASLKKQQDPIVQIALINLLTRMKESGILSELDKIVNDENTEKPVKDCAYSGIITLRSI